MKNKKIIIKGRKEMVFYIQLFAVKNGIFLCLLEPQMN